MSPVSPVPTAEDPYTVPLAIAAQAPAYAPTDRLPRETFAAPGEEDPPTLALSQQVKGEQWPGEQRPEGPWSEDEWSEGAEAWPEQTRRAPWPERLRRALLLGVGAVAAGAAIAAYPWLATVSLLLLTWLLRSISLAASAHDQRRQYRGRKWYDGVQLLIAAPWHLVQSVPGAVLLGLWALGLASAAALVCYAIATGVELALFVCGLVLAGSLWWGPGGSRLRAMADICGSAGRRRWTRPGLRWPAALSARAHAGRCRFAAPRRSTAMCCATARRRSPG